MVLVFLRTQKVCVNQNFFANKLKQNKTIKRPYQNPGLHPMAKSNSEGAYVKDCGFSYLCSH